MNLSFKIVDSTGRIKAQNRDTKEVSLFFEGTYEPGDEIVFECENTPANVCLMLDDALGKSLVYVTGEVRYKIPFMEKRLNISPKAFMGDRHLLYAREAKAFELNTYRNLAQNSYDQHDTTTMFPHAVANVETRGESVFAASNAIDGNVLNKGHGNWPYESWGINMRDDAHMAVEFGRPVKIDRINLYTRADFPHDNYWTAVSFAFFDDERNQIKNMKVNLKKSYAPHEFVIEPIIASSFMLHHMIKSDDPSPFPALTQIEIFGIEEKEALFI